MSQTKTGDIFKEIGKNMGFVGEKAVENIWLLIIS